MVSLQKADLLADEKNCGAFLSHVLFVYYENIFFTLKY